MDRLARRKNDFYPTLKSDSIIAPIKSLVLDDLVLEPCVGKNDIGRHFKNVITVDKYHYSGYNADYYLDMTLESSWEFLSPLSFDWVVTNPPYKYASQILPLAFKYARKGAIFLLRLSYLEPCSDRAEWLKKHKGNLSDLIVLNPRIRFCDDHKGTDNVASAWFVWQKCYHGLTDIVFYNFDTSC
jgi:hypothetical protein